MPHALKTVGLVVALVVALGFMWHQTFEVTGVTAEVVTPGAERPGPPAPPELTPLEPERMDLERFVASEEFRVWSALGY